MSITFLPPSQGDVDQLVAIVHKNREAARTLCGRHYELLAGVYVSTIRALVSSQPNGCPAWTASAVLADQLQPPNDVARMLIFAALADVMDADAAEAARAACTAAAGRSEPSAGAGGGTPGPRDEDPRPPLTTDQRPETCHERLAAAWHRTAAIAQRMVERLTRSRRH